MPPTYLIHLFLLLNILIKLISSNFGMNKTLYTNWLILVKMWILMLSSLSRNHAITICLRCLYTQHVYIVRYWPRNKCLLLTLSVSRALNQLIISISQLWYWWLILECPRKSLSLVTFINVNCFKEQMFYFLILINLCFGNLSLLLMTKV